MSKISIRPDISPSIGLKPTSFPLPDLSKFKVSQTSVAKNPKISLFPDRENVKFVSSDYSVKLPDLFQFNDREKMAFSSDEEADIGYDTKVKPGIVK